MKKQFELIATAAAGLEAVVGRELRNLGYDCQVILGQSLRRISGCVRLIE